ncbi:uncharacterized protein NPIL_62381 [Nephila pilipes]|uniref:Uncharacterized protein n=1 Tax=Nephila pilipes TaxID=299642 RepID=A0A8X6T839_NEPPI|nr:uncharacterized protein NPIL_62381 [Nephila pilipes]
MKTFELTNESRIIIYMCPLSRLTIKKLSRRKLEILFPNGCTCFFKLPLNYGCGTAWSKWRNLENMCVSNRKGFSERWTLISYAELDSSVQSYLKAQMFLRPTRLIVENILMHERDCEVIKDDHLNMCYSADSVSYDTLPIIKEKRPKNGDKFRLFEKILEKGTFLYPSASIKSRLVLDDFSGDDSNYLMDTTRLGKSDKEEAGKELKKPEDKSESKSPIEKTKSVKRTRLVRRFGEGIPEACIFDLSLSYEDSLNDEEHGDPSIQRVSWNASKQLSPFDYLIDEMVIEKTISDLHKHAEDKSDCDNCTKKKVTKETLDIATLCPKFSSILFVPKGIKRSQSVDNLISIEPNLHKYEYLRTNTSLPNLDEVLFHQRNNRLSYISTFDESPVEGRNKSSFWIPSRRTEKNTGRTFCPNPMTQKFEAFRMKSKFYRTNIYSSERKRDFLDDDSHQFHLDIEKVKNKEADPKKYDLLAKCKFLGKGCQSDVRRLFGKFVQIALICICV